jgi:hypothetical protein
MVEFRLAGQIIVRLGARRTLADRRITVQRDPSGW